MSGEQFKKLVTFLDKEPNEILNREIFSKLANKKISKAEISLDRLKKTTMDLIATHIIPEHINLDEKIKNGTAVSFADYIARDQFKVTFKNPEIIKGTSFENFQIQYNDKSNKKEIAIECTKFQKDVKNLKLKGRDINIKDIERSLEKEVIKSSSFVSKLTQQGRGR